MIKLSDAVIQKPSFVKTADYELSKDVSEWNEQILKNFYEEVNYLPKEIGVNVVIKDVDENNGYAKGSIIVFFNGKQINFPIIVKEYKLSPFDVFVKKEGTKDIYYPASEENIKKSLMADQIATLENRWDQARGYQLIKSPGGIMPKQSVNLYDAPEESIYPPFAKMSRWPFLAHKEDLEKFGATLGNWPEIASSFHDNTGDLVTRIVELKDSQREEVMRKDHRQGIIDLGNVINAKQALTALDSELIDTTKLVPLEPPCVAEVRLYEYPSMEDFIGSGDSASERFIASKVGKPITGILLDLVDRDKFSNDCCVPCSVTSSTATEEEKLKAVRNRRDQIFFSLCGKFYSEFSDYNKTGIGFYGTSMLNMPEAVEKAVGMLALVTTDDFVNTNPQNANDGSDKLFAAFNTLDQGHSDHGDGGRMLENSRYGSTYDKGVFIVYGAGTSYECVRIDGIFKKYLVNDSHVYVSPEVVIIPANIASVQKVCSVKDPVYKMIVGKAKNIYLIPESSLVINRQFLKSLNERDFMRPDLSVQQTYEKANITKVALYIASDGKNIGYKIEGKPFESLKKIANLNGQMLNTIETKAALRVMGMSKTASEKAMACALNKFSDYNQKDKNVFIWGVNSDYINPNVFEGQEKIALVKSVLKEIAYNLRRDLTKEASVLTDPNAVDVVLSLNFINEESLGNYIDSVDDMKKVLSDLSQILVASRMGLSDIDETAVKNAIKGLSEVINGLENVKMAVR